MNELVSFGWSEVNLQVGDVIEFPKAAGSRILEINSGRVVLSQGVPGRFKVVSKSPDGSIQLEKLPQ